VIPLKYEHMAKNPFPRAGCDALRRPGGTAPAGVLAQPRMGRFVSWLSWQLSARGRRTDTAAGGRSGPYRGKPAYWRWPAAADILRAGAMRRGKPVNYIPVMSAGCSGAGRAVPVPLAAAPLFPRCYAQGAGN
jgi:hypothetical protein